MWLQTRMYLLIALMFGILYGVIVGVGTWMGQGSAILYLVLAIVIIVIQYLVSPAIVKATMRVKYVTEKEEPELHRMVGALATAANLKKPKVGISELNIPNAFAFGRTQGDGRVCVTRGILRLLSKEELRAVLGHEIAHIQHRDMAIITALSAIPLMLYWLAWTTMWSSMLGGRRQGGQYTVLIGIGAFLLYFITNLLVLYGSRIREYYADQGSVALGNSPHHMATALYKLAYGNARLKKDNPEFKRVEGVKAFFVNDPSRSWYEIKELAQVDRDMSGTIDYNELAALRQKEVKLSSGEKMMEMFTTHPNMLKRIKHLSSLMV